MSPAPPPPRPPAPLPSPPSPLSARTTFFRRAADRAAGDQDPRTRFQPFTLLPLLMDALRHGMQFINQGGFVETKSGAVHHFRMSPPLSAGGLSCPRR